MDRSFFYQEATISSHDARRLSPLERVHWFNSLYAGNSQSTKRGKCETWCSNTVVFPTSQCAQKTSCYIFVTIDSVLTVIEIGPSPKQSVSFYSYLSVFPGRLYRRLNFLQGVWHFLNLGQCQNHKQRFLFKCVSLHKFCDVVLTLCAACRWIHPDRSQLFWFGSITWQTWKVCIGLFCSSISVIASHWLKQKKG